MYRTMDDQLLKCTRQSGPPFFDLRESISMIFNGFMRESKVCERKIFFLIPSAESVQKIGINEKMCMTLQFLALLK